MTARCSPVCDSLTLPSVAPEHQHFGRGREGTQPSAVLAVTRPLTGRSTMHAVRYGWRYEAGWNTGLVPLA